MGLTLTRVMRDALAKKFYKQRREMHEHTYTDKNTVTLPRVVIQLKPAVPLQSDLMYIALSLYGLRLFPSVCTAASSCV